MKNKGRKRAVLITGAGGAAVPTLIELLQSKNYKVIAADMDCYAVGLYKADKGFVIPEGKSRGFVNAIREICRSEKVEAFIPLVDEELINAYEIESDGIPILIPRVDFVRTCLDKYMLMKSLKSSGMRTPETRLACDDIGDMELPCVVKPRVGRGSRGVGIVNSKPELREFIKASPYPEDGLIVQEYIDGPEFTTSVVVWRDGIVKAVVPKEIIFKKGITRMAVTRKNNHIDLLCRNIQKKLEADGPFNVQLRISRNTGEAVPFEVNPRLSTTVTLTIASGCDEVGYLLKKALCKDSEAETGNWHEGVVLLRQTRDQFISEEDFLSCPIVRI